MKLKEIRERVGLTQTAIAKKMGVTSATITQYEKGARTPNAEKMMQLAKILNVTVEDIVKCFVKGA